MENKNPEGGEDPISQFLDNELSPSKMRKLNTGDMEFSTSQSESPLTRKLPTTRISSITMNTSNIKLHGVVTQKGEMRFLPGKNIRVIDFEVADIDGNRIKIAGFEYEAEMIETDVFENQITKNHRVIKKRREMELIDESQTLVRFTVWDSEAENWNPNYLHKVLALKSVKPYEYRDALCLKTTSDTDIDFDPKSSEVSNLLDWYEKKLPGLRVLVLSEISHQNEDAIITISETCRPDVPQYFIVNAIITGIEPRRYKGCLDDECYKKVEEEDGGYYCKKCRKSTLTFQWLYLMRIELTDWTDQIDVTAFNEIGTELVGKSAQELEELKVTNEQQYNEILQGLIFQKKQWKIRSKTEESGNQFIVHSVKEIEKDDIMEKLEDLTQQLQENNYSDL